MEIEKLIKAIRESFSGSVAVYTYGGCYQFHVILKTVFPDAEGFYDGNHCWTKINGKYYDIKGEADLGDRKLRPVTERDLLTNRFTDEKRQEMIKEWRKHLRKKIILKN